MDDGVKENRQSEGKTETEAERKEDTERKKINKEMITVHFILSDRIIPTSTIH